MLWHLRFRLFRLLGTLSLFRPSTKLTDLIGPTIEVWGFQYIRYPVDAWVFHSGFEGSPSDLAVAEGFVAIDPGAKVFFGVVEMHRFEEWKPHQLVETLDHVVTALFCADVVAGCECVGCIDADPYPFAVLNVFDDFGEVFEGKSEVGALAGGVFDDSGNLVGFTERQVDRFCDAAEAVLFRNFSEMAARVEVDHKDAELFGSLELVEESFAGLPEFVGVGVAEVDEVAVVWQDRLHRKAVFNAALFEEADGFVGEWRGGPATLVFGEECESGGADFVGTDGGFFDSACSANVSSDVLHRVFLMSCFGLVTLQTLLCSPRVRLG